MVSKLIGWFLVLSVASLSAKDMPISKAQKQSLSKEIEDMGDQDVDGLGVKGTNVLEERQKKANAKDDKQIESFIRGGFCMLTVALFVAGFIGTKSHKGHRVERAENPGDSGRFFTR